MGLLSSIGRELKGLLGDEAFLDRIEQAQAFSRGDHMAAARIGARIRDRRARQGKPGAPGAVGFDPETDDWAEPELERIHRGYSYWGRRPGDPSPAKRGMRESRHDPR